MILNDIQIEKIGYGWIWIATHTDWRKIIVKWGLFPGFVVDCKVIKKKKDYLQAKLIQIKSFWDFELQKTCAHYDEGCGGCKWSILSYQEQLKQKKDLIHDSFRFFPEFAQKFADFELVPCDKQRYYRNKMEFSFGKIYPQQNWNLWLHKQWAFWQVVDVKQCFLISQKMHTVFEYLKKELQNSGLPVYDQKTHKWFFRHLVLRQWADKVLVNLSVADKHFEQAPSDRPKWEQLAQKIKDDFEQNDTSYHSNNLSDVGSFWLNYNNWLGDSINSQNSYKELLFGNEYIQTKLNLGSFEVDFRLGPDSFFQTNTSGAEKLLKKTFEMLGKTDWNVLDLYCGAGTIGLSYLKFNKTQNSKNHWNSHSIVDWANLYWMEIVPEAIYNAKINAEINNLSSFSNFFVGNCNKVFDLNLKLSNVWVVFVDPPRAWLEKNLINFLIKLKKTANFKLIYISCNPNTMSRDVNCLVRWWFVLENYKAVDMFPNTYHIENIWLLV